MSALGGVLEAALWGALAASSLLIGALIAVAFRLPDRLVGVVMGFGSGALIAAVAYELLPKEGEHDWTSFFMLGLGAGTFYTLDRVVTRRERGARAASGRSIVLGALLDGIPESAVLGMGLAAGGSISVAFLTAVFVSNLPEALGATANLREAGQSGASICRLWTLLVAVSAACAALGYALLRALPQADGHTVQAYAAGAVLTMLADSMMPEAFDLGGKVTGLATVLGFALAGGLSFVE